MAAQTPMLAPRGAILMSIVTEGSAPGTTATRLQLSRWIASARAPFTMTLDSVGDQPPMEDFFGRPRDTYILVNLQTMTIVNITANNVMAALQELDSLLMP